MKCIVIYFSQTGNTEKVARAIQAGVKQAAGQCDIVKVADANPRRLNEYDLIGLGGPVWGVAPPNVQVFINNMRFVGGKHIFPFCTHTTSGFLYIPHIIPMLKNRGLIVIGYKRWYADSCYPWHTYPHACAGHPDEIDLKEAEDFGKEMVERSQRISAGETNLIPPAPEMPSMDPPPGNITTRDTDKYVIKYHKAKCLYPKCHLCMDNCPARGIDLTMKPRVIAEPCLKHCAFCTMICPTGALEMDDFIKRQLPNYKESGEWLATNRLEKAEAEGRFRRLLPKEKVGFGTCFAEVCNGHPKWIIGKGAQPGKAAKQAKKNQK